MISAEDISLANNYVSKFIDATDNLPLDLQRILTEIIEYDVELNKVFDQIKKEEAKCQAENSTDYAALECLLDKYQKISDEKLKLSAIIYEIVEANLRSLEEDKRAIDQNENLRNIFFNIPPQEVPVSTKSSNMTPGHANAPITNKPVNKKVCPSPFNPNLSVASNTPMHSINSPMSDIEEQSARYSAGNSPYYSPSQNNILIASSSSHHLLSTSSSSLLTPYGAGIGNAFGSNLSNLHTNATTLFNNGINGNPFYNDPDFFSAIKNDNSYSDNPMYAKSTASGLTSRSKRHRRLKGTPYSSDRIESNYIYGDAKLTFFKKFNTTPNRGATDEVDGSDNDGSLRDTDKQTTFKPTKSSDVNKKRKRKLASQIDKNGGKYKSTNIYAQNYLTTASNRQIDIIGSNYDDDENNEDEKGAFDKGTGRSNTKISKSDKPSLALRKTKLFNKYLNRATAGKPNKSGYPKHLQHAKNSLNTKAKAVARMSGKGHKNGKGRNSERKSTSPPQQRRKSSLSGDELCLKENASDESPKEILVNNEVAKDEITVKGGNLENKKEGASLMSGPEDNLDREEEEIGDEASKDKTITYRKPSQRIIGRVGATSYKQHAFDIDESRFAKYTKSPPATPSTSKVSTGNYASKAISLHDNNDESDNDDNSSTDNNNNGEGPKSRPKLVSRRSSQHSHKRVRGHHGRSVNDSAEDSTAEDDDEDDEEEYYYMGKTVDPNEPTYCLCNRVSYGEMIGCDNPRCVIEWFHFDCVNLAHKPKGKWYCPKCRKDSVGKICRYATTNVPSSNNGNTKA